MNKLPEYSPWPKGNLLKQIEWVVCWPIFTILLFTGTIVLCIGATLAGSETATDETPIK